MAAKDCRAKDPNTCTHHGSGKGSAFVAKMMNALKGRDFATYEACRQEVESGAVTLPPSNQPVMTMEDADNAVRADYGSWGYRDMHPWAKVGKQELEYDRLQKAAPHLTEGIVTPAAIDAYNAERLLQEGKDESDETDEQKEISRVAARHILTNVLRKKEPAGSQ